LDSLADFVFVLAVGYKLFPWLKLPATLWMMIGLVALVKMINAISSFVVKMLASIAEREQYRQRSIISLCLPHSVGADIKE
jgi:CDP-diacylglycerol--glycerol-3-phosphate 3-phosphatidyltransferase